MRSAFDLAVIGGGPAGASAALSAARAGLSVGLFEPCAATTDKPCGEGILPAGVAALRALGFETLLATGTGLERVRYVLSSGRALEIPFSAAGIALERPRLAGALDEALARESGVTRIDRRVATEQTAHGFAVLGRRESWTARTLVAADGGGGRSARWLRAGPRPRPRHGLRARAEARSPLDAVEVHLGRTSEVYLTPLPLGRVNVCVLCGELPAERGGERWLAAALREHPRAARRLGAWTSPPEARALVHVARPRVAAAGAFLCGDAAGGVDPILGCGVALALVTGVAAGQAAARVLATGSGEPERAYERFVRRETGLRRRVARALLSLGSHPLLQASVVLGFTLLPGAARGMLRRVGGA